MIHASSNNAFIGLDTDLMFYLLCEIMHESLVCSEAFCYFCALISWICLRFSYRCVFPSKSLWKVPSRLVLPSSSALALPTVCCTIGNRALSSSWCRPLFFGLDHSTLLCALPFTKPCQILRMCSLVFVS